MQLDAEFVPENVARTLFHSRNLSKYVHYMISDEAMQRMIAEMDWIGPFWVISDDPMSEGPENARCRLMEGEVGDGRFRAMANRWN